MNIETLQAQLLEFSEERDWRRFHTPKNLAIALSVEASELVEIFQWMSDTESASVMGSSEAHHVREEMADVLIYLLRLADVLSVDLEEAVAGKIRQNAERFPRERRATLGGRSLADVPGDRTAGSSREAGRQRTTAVDDGA